MYNHICIHKDTNTLYCIFDMNRDHTFSEIAKYIKRNDTRYTNMLVSYVFEGDIIINNRYIEDRFLIQVNDYASHFKSCTYYSGNAIVEKMFPYSEYPNITRAKGYAYGLLNRSKYIKETHPHEDTATVPTKHFIFMNGAAKLYRARLYNDFAKNNIEKISHVSWLNRYGSLNSYDITRLKELLNERFYTNLNKRRYLDVPNLNSSLDPVNSVQEKISKYYDNSAIDIFVESVCENNHVIFPTEKTWKPILDMKPFLGFSSKGYYKWLQSEGFLLYEDLFDYSFDDISDTEERYKGFFENIIKISRLSISDLNTKVRKIQHVLQHNKNHAIGKTHVPKELRFIPDNFGDEGVFYNPKYSYGKYE